MVDPNRKINRLTDKDIEFLDECEEEFANRFTNDDSEFVQHCSKEYGVPPIVQNWCENKPFHRNQQYGGNYSGNYGGRQNNRHRYSAYRREYDRHRRDSRGGNWNSSR